MLNSNSTNIHFSNISLLNCNIFTIFQHWLTAKNDISNIEFFPDCFGTKGPSSMRYEFRECGKDLDDFQCSWEKGGKPPACRWLHEEPGCDD